MKQSATILYIEDDQDMIELMTMALKRRGFRVIGAIGGEAGWQAMLTQEPDVVILDLMMPGVDGWEILRRRKEHPHLIHTPVIVATARSRRADKAQAAFLNQVNDYIIKPFSIAELVEKIETVLEKQ